MITKEELEKRGIIQRHPDECHYITLKDIDINVHIEESGDVIVELDRKAIFITVPNCKTLKDLDHLIKLFS